MGFNKSKEQIEKSTYETLQTIESRGHLYVSGEYLNRQSSLVVFCPIHGQEHRTTFYNYNRSRIGIPCCGNEQVKQKLTNRQFSAETLEKMQKSANKRPDRGGLPRSSRKERPYMDWKEQVSKLGNFECAITGEKGNQPGDLVGHHLYGFKEYPLLRYNSLNGIWIHKDLHKLFHKYFGYRKNTLSQITEFLLLLLEKQKFGKKSDMLISNQAKLQKLEGSETRVFDCEKVLKLHEHLERIDKDLRFQFFSDDKK